VIRTARLEDLPALQEIERAAGEAFREIGMEAVADEEPSSIDDLAAYQGDERAWVATDRDDRPVAYILVRHVDAGAHIEQVSVHPDHARRAIGAMLIRTAEEWARERHLGAVTLTTFRDVPWNAPYYERLGFSIVPDPELTDGLRDIREDEGARGLDRWPRVVMQRSLGP
jgi:GNAT superfamily N-acetyltransferase